MSFLRIRRFALLAIAALPLLCAPTLPAADLASPQQRFAALEQQLHGRLGVYAIDTATGATLGYRADERFAFASTFKAVLCAAILARSESQADLLERRILYTAADMVNYSPITEQHLATGMTVAELCAAAIQYSDNTAANLLLRLVDGPAGLTRFARVRHDSTFRLDRIETALNSAIPLDPRDTSSPMAMARLLQSLTLGDGLAAAQREQLHMWLAGNTTGARRIAAGVPRAWKVADKTGTGDYAAAGDIAVVTPPDGAPWVVAIYTTQPAQDARANEAVIAEAMRVIVAAWR